MFKVLHFALCAADAIFRVWTKAKSRKFWRRSARCLNERGDRLQVAGLRQRRADIESLGEPLDKIIAPKIGWGKSRGLARRSKRKSRELAATGKLAYYEELKSFRSAGAVGDAATFRAWDPRKSRRSTTSSASRPSPSWKPPAPPAKWGRWMVSAKKRRPISSKGFNAAAQYASRHLVVRTLPVAEPLLESLRQHPE